MPCQNSLNNWPPDGRIGWMFKLHCIIGIAAAGMAAAAGLADHPHPRLWFPKAAEAAFKQSLAADPLQAKLQAAAMAEADKVLKSRTCRYEIPDGKRLLAESRLAVHNVLFSAWAWRSGGDEKYRTRTLAELDAACALKDWNPSHFLDTAEMSTAVAVGYDWLYPTLTDAQRATYERALIDKGLKPAKAVYDKNSWWSKPGNNWSQVCGAGIALAAAAVAGHDEGLGEELFGKGLRLVEQCGKFYQPDGMYPEGPGYWQYGTSYHVAMLAACDPLSQAIGPAPEMKLAGDSIMQLTSPNRLSYNFADGGSGRAVPSSAQCWLAGHYRDAAQTAYVRGLLERVAAEEPKSLAKDRFFPLAVLWLPKAAAAPTLTKAAAFGGQQAVAVFRSGWQPKDAYLAIKGGTAAASHGHMDVGSFVYDAHGERWCHDLGAEDYNLPGYFGNKRWTYYRLQNRSHNTLEIDGQLQNPKSKPCPITASTLTGSLLRAAFDLTDAYAGAATKVTRTAAFEAASGVASIEDVIEQPAGDVVWRVFTDAAVKIVDGQVRLEKKGAAITLRQTAGGGTWSVAEATPPTPEEHSNKGFRAVTLTVPKAEKVKIGVEIQP